MQILNCIIFAKISDNINVAAIRVFCKKKPSGIEKQKVLEWFGSADNYIAYHTQKIYIAMIKDWMIE